ncbi:hemoglobin/transferrin/lactoferrin receptor protein [Lysobacter sp. yr284]|uniref:TonB-dependent receptor n=1 Tax=Lysobacter sp. yr284 TaxID=1761791 RepID=UPI00089B71E1|nr:TonB-dependent receptor [Lysobacter sp. yr284]SDY81650.1 hemoglobin/transferrin/lactoferrin receptor protein [Lysobacter sp. yr284]
MSFAPARRRRPSARLALAACIHLALTGLCVPVAGAQAPAAQLAPAVRRYEIPAQPLAAALRQYSRISGVQVVFDSAEGEGLRSAPLHGDYDDAQALRALLAGTGLGAQRSGAGTVVLRKAAARAQGGDAPLTTDTLSVGAAAYDDASQRDERGYDQVYDLDLSTVYAGKAQIERYKGAAPADVFKGMLNVYSGDARNSGALDPNIRGIQGPGRVPLTIDGTEQALTVWRGYNGANNRNYIDPNLIGGIQVIKGPNLTRNVSSSIGGAVVVNTLDVADILKPGERFGGEFKAESSDNATDPRLPRLSTGQDYRTIPGFPSNPQATYYDPTLYKPVRSSGGNDPIAGDDHAMRLALGLREERFDLLAAYAYRKKGNHFSGENGGDFYARPYDPAKSLNYITSLARFYHPGDEVPNTSSEMESWLFKATLRASERQTLKFGFRDTRSDYGEILPTRISWRDTTDTGAPQWPLSKVEAKAYNLEYKWQPGGRWFDVYANLWTTRTLSDTYSAGGFPNWATFDDPLLRNTALANAHHDRKGLTFSNKSALRSDLDLTVGFNYQHETLRSDDEYNGVADGWRMFPRAGRREERDFSLKLDWRASERLSLSAGARHQSYWAFDDFLADQLAKGDTRLGQVLFPQRYAMTYFTRDPRMSQTALDARIATIRRNAERFGWTPQVVATQIEQATYTVRNVAPDWRPDANGRFRRADNVFLNGSLDGTDYGRASASLQPLFLQQQAQHHDGSGWTPTVAATFNVSDNARLYFRHSQARRYPSMFESTLGFSAALPVAPLKPERAYNYELAYVHDFSRALGADYADLKLTYYHHQTRNVIERSGQLQFSNLDKQTLRGLEFQGRYDNGRFFSDLSVARNLENEVCDESVAAINDPTGRIGVPDCVQAGFVGGYLITQALPKLSANWTLGGRFLERRLEVGARVVHHSGYENGDYDLYQEQRLGAYFNVPLAWDRITTYDAYVNYRVSDALALELVGTNLGDLYYVDPLTRSAMAAPGRTLKLSLTAKF